MVNKIKVSDLIAEFLEKLEIKTIFGIIGSANSHIFDSINKRGYTQIVCVHHEQSAVMAMGAYFRASGKLSAAIVTAGAGSSNAITGVISNWADSIPGFIFSGQEQSKYLESHKELRMFGIQGFDSPKMVSQITKHATTIKNPENIQIELEVAHHITKKGRPGPVWIDIPFDIQSKMVEPKEWHLNRPDTSTTYDAAPVLAQMDVDYILHSLKESKRPVIWAGHGVRLSVMKEEFRKLVDILQIPVILTWSGIDLLHDEDPMYFGRAGLTGMRHSNFIIQNCDFLLVLGSRLSLLQTGYDLDQFAPHAKIALVDISHNEWNKHPSDMYDRIIMQDCRNIIKDLIRENQTFFKPDWIVYCNKMKSKYPLLEKCHDDNEYINSYRFLDLLSSKLKGNEIIVTDMGTALLSGHYIMRMKKDNIMFTSLGLGEMGYGLPGAIGAAFAHPDRDIICLHCDGGMMMNLQELQTIVHHNLRIKIIVFNNDGYLMIKNTQNMLFKGHKTCVDKKTGVSCPDFSKLGTAFGYNVIIPINGQKYINEHINDFMATTKPTIMEVFMDPNQEFLPKVKGVSNEDGTITPVSLEEMSPLLPYKDIEESMIAGVNPKSKLITRQ
jgi:acetolactate synthase-1/2/3 large subunit